MPSPPGTCPGYTASSVRRVQLLSDTSEVTSALRSSNHKTVGEIKRARSFCRAKRPPPAKTNGRESRAGPTVESMTWEADAASRTRRTDPQRSHVGPA